MIFPRQQITSDPRQHNFVDMIKTSLCPRLHLQSVAGILGIMIVGFYVVGLVWMPSPTVFISPSPDYIIKIGAIQAYKLLDYQIWRLFVACFLVSDLLSICITLLMVLCIASQTEAYFGSKVTLLCYILPGINGGLLTAYYSLPQDVILSSSFSAVGLIGIVFGAVIINWNSLGEQASMLCCLLSLLVIFIIMGSQTKQIAGNMSGILYCQLALFMGFLLSLYAITPMANNSYEQRCKQIGLFGSITFMVMVVFVFFLLYGK